MSAERDQRRRDGGVPRKYAPLYRRLLSTPTEREWRTTFRELEAILGFRLPDRARAHGPWWSNSGAGRGHGHSRCWRAAGWRTKEVDVDAETLVFARSPDDSRPEKPSATQRKFTLDEVLSASDLGPWPEGFTVSREQIYDDMGRLTGGTGNDD